MNAFLRLLGRSVVVMLVCACGLLIAVQYWHALSRTAALGRELTAAKRDIGDLRSLRTRQMSEIRRLSDPQGAIPEIHDRLRLVAGNETLIYVEGAATPAPSAAP
jgi:hypothetical protein